MSTKSATNNTYRFAVIGAGAVGQTRYVPALADHQDVALDWIVDVDEARAKQVASAVDARFTSEHTTVLDDVDAAVLATPPKYHEAIARDCIEAGVDLLTEKPVAMSSEAAMEVTELSKHENIEYAISRQYREAPACRLLHGLVERGVIGEVQHVVGRFGDETNWDFATDYRVRESRAGGGVLTDKGPHLLDIVRWILSQDLHVERYADDSYGGLEANAELWVSLPGTDTTGWLELSASRNIPNSIELVGSHGRMQADLGGTAVTLRTENMDDDTRLTATGPNQPTTSTARMTRQVHRFVDSLGSEECSYVPAATDVHILELVEECYANREQLDKPWEQVAVSGGGIQ